MTVNVSKKELALRYLRKNPRTPVRKLAELFEIHLRIAYRVIEDYENETLGTTKNIWDNIEKEIEGLDWKYNPERDIQHLNIPRY